MPLSLYNTFSKKEEKLVTLEPGKVRMYTCGPTVYGRPHIGNYSSFLMADLLRRWLEVSGFTVKHVKNITDVGHLVHDADHGDDKIQSQAEREKLHPLEIARRYTEQYLDDERALSMIEPEARPRASAFIKEQLKIIKTLMEKGNAYETNDGIYFSVLSFPQYGALSGNTLQNLNAGARIEVDEQKKHPADFALWKKCVGDNGRHVLRWKFSNGDVSTSSGEDASSGFPGWHIECSAMSAALLGTQIDIHTGGEDNIFPHHECEIAQSESASGKKFVGLWLHKRRIDLGDAKMSKSLGNILTISDVIEKGYSPLDLRYYLLSVHYRTNLKFAWKGMDDAKKERQKILEWMSVVQEDAAKRGVILSPSARLRINSAKDDTTRILQSEAKKSSLSDFAAAMNEDLNTSAARANIFEHMHAYYEHGIKNNDELQELLLYMSVIRSTFGCFEPEEEIVPADVQTLINERQAARDRKDFKESDRLRDAIKERGFDVKDTPQGQRAKRT